jgi:hypothetical protein
MKELKNQTQEERRKWKSYLIMQYVRCSWETIQAQRQKKGKYQKIPAKIKKICTKSQNSKRTGGNICNKYVGLMEKVHANLQEKPKMLSK